MLPLETNLLPKYSGAMPVMHLNAISASIKYKLFFTGSHLSLFPDIGARGAGGTRYIKKVGMLVENFEIDP